MSLIYPAGGAVTALGIVGLCMTDSLDAILLRRHQANGFIQICCSMAKVNNSMYATNKSPHNQRTLDTDFCVTGRTIPRDRLSLRLGGPRHWVVYRIIRCRRSLVRECGRLFALWFYRNIIQLSIARGLWPR